MLGNRADNQEKISPVDAVVGQLKRYEPFLWVNPLYRPVDFARPFSKKDILETEARLQRFAPYLVQEFPETAALQGLIDSPLTLIEDMKTGMESLCGTKILGKVYLKQDNRLAIAGSVKARGGIYEVLKFAEDLALNNGLIVKGDDYRRLGSPEARDFFSQYFIHVASTGNLGLSIGIISSHLGFKVRVYMSVDAKQWKKDLLRQRGAEVLESKLDYSQAVEQGRCISQEDDKSYFIDDENSIDLFLGYAVSAYRLQAQLKKLNITVDRDHPLFVTIPCGVGGAPGGIAYGLKLYFGDNIHIFFAEPTHSPCLLLGMHIGRHNKISIYDIGLDNLTIADGLAVAKASSLVGKLMEHRLAGIYTVKDDWLYQALSLVKDTEGIGIEPSAAAGFFLPFFLKSDEGRRFLNKHGLEGKEKNFTSIVWATGGNLVPYKDFMDYYMKGKALQGNELRATYAATEMLL
jgi:D-serine dehydratase